MVIELNTPSMAFKKKKFYLNGPPELIRQRVKSALSNYFDNDEKIESHLKYHFIKYIYVIDRILRANRYWNKPMTGFHYLDYRSLFQITNHRSYELKDESKMTLASMVTRVLEEAGLLKRSKKYSRIKNLSYEYKVLEIPGHQFELFDLDNLDLNQHDQIFLEKLEDHQKTKFYRDSDIAEKMSIWMQNLDFSRVNRFKLSKNHSEYLLLFEESKFQVLADTGRIYNSFTNLPKTIRKDVWINGEYLGDLDIANAQAIFLCKIVTDRLIEENKVLSESTKDFKIWAELGKAFEFLNGKENFKHSQTREAFKSAFWSLLMDKSSKSHTYKIYPKVLEKIPQIMEVVDEIKKKDHRVMSHLLQREESRVMMRCYKEIMNEVISSPIHDALFFPFSQWNLVTKKVLKTLEVLGIKCTLKWQGYSKDGIWKSGIEMTFTPDLDHSEVMYYHATMFKWYPAKYKSTEGKNYDKSSIPPVSKKVSKTIKLNKIKKMKTTQEVLKINNVDELSPKKMLQLDDSIYEGKIKTILLGGVEVSFSLLLCAHLKSLMEKDELVEGFYPCLLIENNIEELLGLVFNDGFLPDEIFAMGAGIYQFDDQDGYLLAYPENPYRKQFSLEESWNQGLKAKKGFLRIQISELQMHFRNKSHILETDAYYENSFPIFNYCGFEEYFMNWLRGHDFVVEEGKFIVRNSDFDQVA